MSDRTIDPSGNPRRSPIDRIRTRSQGPAFTPLPLPTRGGSASFPQIHPTTSQQFRSGGYVTPGFSRDLPPHMSPFPHQPTPVLPRTVEEEEADLRQISESLRHTEALISDQQRHLAETRARLMQARAQRAGVTLEPISEQSTQFPSSSATISSPSSFSRPPIPTPARSDSELYTPSRQAINRPLCDSGIKYLST